MIKIPLAKTLKEEELDKNKSRFSIEPLYPGYGLTVGNALRRVLLSSLSGAAIEAVKINGVEHEFSAIEWVKEDMVDIILNLKQVSVKLAPEIVKQAEESGEPVRLTLNAKGVGEVKVGDFKKIGGVEITNPDLHLLTMTDTASNLEMEVIVGYGLGYSPTEDREDREYEVGMIAIDSSYSPVKRVGYDIENVRVGQMTNWDKINLDIETDGAVSCKEVLEKSVDILVEQFSALQAMGVNEEPEVEAEPSKEKEVEEETK